MEFIKMNDQERLIVIAAIAEIAKSKASAIL
jgi:hypothetical protein